MTFICFCFSDNSGEDIFDDMVSNRSYLGTSGVHFNKTNCYYSLIGHSNFKLRRLYYTRLITKQIDCVTILGEGKTSKCFRKVIVIGFTNIYKRKVWDSRNLKNYFFIFTTCTHSIQSEKSKQYQI